MSHGKTGFHIQYSVEETDGKGLGVFAREAVSEGSVVWRHVPGTFVVYDERTFEEKIGRMSPAEVIYELTHVHAFEEFPGCLIRALDDGILINHSNAPNLATNKNAPAKVALDLQSPEYLQKVTEALCDDRYSLVAVRDIASGEELANDYNADDECPPYYDALCSQYDVREDFLDDGQDQ